MDAEIVTQQKFVENIPCGYSMSTILGFDQIENKHNLYCWKGCMKRFCDSLGEQGKAITDFEKKKLLWLTRKELKSHEDVKKCYISGKGHPSPQKKQKTKQNKTKQQQQKNRPKKTATTTTTTKNNKYITNQKVRYRCHYTGKYTGTTHSICNLNFKVPNVSPAVFHNSSNYDFYYQRSNKWV